MAILKAGQTLSTTQGSKGNPLATKHHEIMEASHKDYVKKVDNLPNAFNKVQAANEAILAYEQEIDGATPVRAEELVKNVVDNMVPVGENEYPYEQLVEKIVYKTHSDNSVGCYSSYLRHWGHSLDITKEYCHEYCGGKGHKYFALAAGGYCDCGDELDGMEPVEHDPRCNMACPGEPTQKCGTGGASLVFECAATGAGAEGKLDLYQTAHEEATSMCDGAPIQPVLEVNSADDCSTRCYETISPAKCVGFQYYSGLSDDAPGICMMFSAMESYVHYAGEACPAGKMDAKCYVQKTELGTQRALKESQATQAIDGCFN
jgi:hypothetical protein